MCEVPHLRVSEQHAGHGTPDSSGPDRYIAGNLGTDLWEYREGGCKLKRARTLTGSLPGIACALRYGMGYVVAPPHSSAGAIPTAAI